MLALGAYRTAFRRPGAGIGLQAETLGAARIWVLPNPSGLNGHYQLERLAELYAQLHEAAEPPRIGSVGCKGGHVST